MSGFARPTEMAGGSISCRNVMAWKPERDWEGKYVFIHSEMKHGGGWN
jgi:hypothetical protein